jgi:hypothetical protein
VEASNEQNDVFFAKISWEIFGDLKNMRNFASAFGKQPSPKASEN